MANITKRKDSFLIRVSCGYDAKGKQIIKSKTWKPEEGMTERQIEKELNKVAVEFENNVQNGNIADTYRIKMDSFCKEYLTLIENSVAPLTHNNYSRIVNKIIVPYFGHMKIREIKPAHIQRFIQMLQEPAARTDKKGGTLAPSSVQRYFTVLKSIMSKAYKLGYIDNNPTDTARLDLPKVKQPDIEIFSQEEAAYMLGCLENEPLQFKLLIHLAIVTGCRRGELVALQWQYVDLEKKTIEVRQSNYKIKGEDISTKTTKTGEKRIFSIPDYCIELLKKHRLTLKQERLKLGSLWQEGNWLFTQWNGQPMHPHTPSQWFEKFQKRHDIPHRKFHALRHTSATLLLTSGTNIKTVASRLGHTQLSTTNRYVHSLESADKVASNTFDDMFSPKEKSIMNK
ncbi:MAG: tyrosine-type recombinase/integrase [Clostridiales bacterium]